MRESVWQEMADHGHEISARGGPRLCIVMVLETKGISSVLRVLAPDGREKPAMAAATASRDDAESIKSLSLVLEKK
jgi:hypothetical protein